MDPRPENPNVYEVQAWLFTIKPGDHLNWIDFQYTQHVDLLEYIQTEEKDWQQLWHIDGLKYVPRWPLSQFERARLALLHEPGASSSPDGYRLATCVACERPMVAMWHLWLDAGGLKKEIHMCHACATDIYGAPTPDGRGQIDLIEGPNGELYAP